MAWKNLKWDPAQERLDDFVYKLRRIAKELGYDEDEQLEVFKCCVPSHLYIYLQGATTLKEAMENIKRACALGGVSVQATPVETRTTPTVPFMQMADRQDFRNVPRNDDHIELTALKFKGVMDSLDKCMDRLVKTVEKSAEKQSRRMGRDSRDSRDSRNSRDNNRSYRSDSDSSSEDDSYHRYRSRSRDNSRNRSRSRRRSSKTCTYYHKPNHDLSHCYKLAKELKKLYSGDMKIDGIETDMNKQDMLSCIKNYLESEKDSTNKNGIP